MTISIYDSHTLIGVQRKLRPINLYWLDRLFPSVVNFDDEFIDFDVVDDGRRIAPFVSPMVQGRVMKDRGYETRKFKPAYLKPKHILDASKPLKRLPGESIGGNLSAGARWNAHVTEKMRIQRDMILRRWELMAASAVINGSVVVSGEDYPSATVDFQRPAALTVTPATAWDDTTPSIVANLDSWATLVQEESGMVVVRYTMTPDVWEVFRADEEVKELLDTRRGSESQLETGPGNGSPAQYKGTFGGSIDVYVYNDIYEDDEGNKQPMMPPGTLIMDTGNIEGIRAFGAILDGRAGYQSNDIFPKMWENDDPAVTYIMSQSAPLMIPGKPEGSLRANVLS